MPDSIDTLQRKLQEAQEAFYARRGKPFDSAEYDKTHRAVLSAEVALAKAKSEPFAVPLDVGFVTGREAPIVLCADSTTVLVCEASRANSDGIYEDIGYAIVEFPLCDWSTFGYPNDEAIEGHPMYGKGLDSYDAFEVFNSPWKRRMTEQNRVAFPDTKESATRHLIFSFHESTFECLAEQIEVTTMKADYSEVFMAASAIVNRH